MNKTTNVMEHLCDMECDVCFIQETFLKEADTAKKQEIKDYGWQILSNPRKYRSGGGIAVLYKPCVSLKCNERVNKYKSFQVMETVLQGCSEEIRFVNVYRPPYTRKARFTEANFLEEFESYLDEVVGKPGIPLIGGDFNIHIERSGDLYPKRYLDLLSVYDLFQCVPLVPTHEGGGTIDHVITNEKGKSLIKNLSVTKEGTSSDHYLISFDLDVNILDTTDTTRTSEYRRFADIDIESFKSDLRESA